MNSPRVRTRALQTAWIRHRRARWAAVATAVALLGLTVVPASAVPGVAPAHHDGDHTTKNVVANLFEWNWPSVAHECTSVLGPAGYAAVQVAPPQDSLRRTSLGNGSDTVLHPWWEVYQPVDYNLTSRMGNEAQFKSMVSSCRKAGVKVIVDAVINHMTGQGNLSYGGVSYSKYDYAGLYSTADFHHNTSPADCPTADGTIDDFNNYTQVFKCELVGLADLRTESGKVRDTIAAYLNKLIGYGVSGFRVDAAKHIGQPDLAAIESRLHTTADGTKPYLALEVGTGSPGRISPQAFESVGSPLGFDFASQLESAFKSYTATPGGNIGDLKILGAGSGLLPSDKTLAFVENHDTERNGSTLNYKSDSNTVATEFMLAYGYGTPEVYAGFAWTTSDDSPPSDANGMITSQIRSPHAQFAAPGWRLDAPVEFDVAATATHVLAPLVVAPGVTPGQVEISTVNADGLNIFQLAHAIDAMHAAGRRTAELEGKWWHKISGPLSALLMPLLGAVAAFGLARSGQLLIRSVIGMMLGFTYFVLDNAALAMGNFGAYPPMVAAWAPFFLFLLVGETVLIRTEE